MAECKALEIYLDDLEFSAILKMDIAKDGCGREREKTAQVLISVFSIGGRDIRLAR